MKNIENLKQIAADQVSQYPQYKNHFDTYILVNVLRQIKTKSGIAFDKDEVSIAEPGIRQIEIYNPKKKIFQLKDFYTVWSFKNSCDTLVPVLNIKKV